MKNQTLDDKMIQDLLEFQTSILLEKGENKNFLVTIVREKLGIKVNELKFKGYAEKEKIRQEVLKKLVNTKNLLGYALVFEVCVTDMKNRRVFDAKSITKYTREQRKFSLSSYHFLKQDWKIEKLMTNDRSKDIKDNWDLWGEHIDIDSDIQKDYIRFQKENPRLYQQEEGETNDQN